VTGYLFEKLANAGVFSVVRQGITVRHVYGGDLVLDAYPPGVGRFGTAMKVPFEVFDAADRTRQLG
jgi:hypothetical protein